MQFVVSSIIVLILLFVDGIIFGVAAAKGILSIVLIILGLILAGFIGIAIPFLSSTIVLNHLTAIVTTQAKYFSYYTYGFPLAWIVGFVVGLLLV